MLCLIYATRIIGIENIVVDPGVSHVKNKKRIFERIEHLIVDKFKILCIELRDGGGSIAVYAEHGIPYEAHGIRVSLTRPFIADNFANVPLVRVNHISEIAIGNEEIIPVSVIADAKPLPAIKYTVVHGEPHIIC